MRRLRRIKILATLGPASSDSAMIRRLFEAGADVAAVVNDIVSNPNPESRAKEWLATASRYD